MKKIEKILIVIFIVALVFKLFFINGFNNLILLSSLILSFLYFFLGFAFFNNVPLKGIFKKHSYEGISAWRIIGTIGFGYGLMAIIEGIAFKFLVMPGAQICLIGGLLVFLIILIVGGVRYFRNRSDFYLRIFKRMLIFGTIGLILFQIPQMKWISIIYRKYPAVIEAYKEAWESPDNNDRLWIKVDEERSKVHNREN